MINFPIESVRSESSAPPVVSWGETKKSEEEGELTIFPFSCAEKQSKYIPKNMAREFFGTRAKRKRFPNVKVFVLVRFFRFFGTMFLLIPAPHFTGLVSPLGLFSDDYCHLHE
ncbi:hypothetical protein JFY68_06765 [Porphyromonas gingivalis]|uniref:hypothetical protein n=1 Tax=Porphyromonas gingivalis TaxID=837 RepID=UPI00079B777D|nr:hypothetical protein [Porphyromonas gingivalis]KXC09318.1 hypothetical protein AT291_00730 [Porphyromonas gingivalis]MCE8173246.1 hypothetical protein [Porphyromonas gingivalis]MCE8176834.1 hypothetical protein [Porphyromonas gingivalis]